MGVVGVAGGSVRAVVCVGAGEPAQGKTVLVFPSRSSSPSFQLYVHRRPVEAPMGTGERSKGWTLTIDLTCAAAKCGRQISGGEFFSGQRQEKEVEEEKRS